MGADVITTDLARKMARSYTADMLLAIEAGEEQSAGYLAGEAAHWSSLHEKLAAAELARTDLEMREADYAHGDAA
jgi:hypothetical protein